MNKPVLIIFAKAPRRGQVKRRLAAEIGDAAALQFYLQQIRHRLLDLRNPKWDVVLALSGPWRLPVPMKVVVQGRGDLGQRMRRVLDGVTRPAVLIGADIPDVASGHIAAAFAEVRRTAFGVGPAADGGSWLVGTRRPCPLPRQVFTGVRWSSAYALADTLKTLPRGKVGFSATLSDVDHANDLRAYLKRRRGSY